MLLYHHCRSFESVVYGEVKPDIEYSDPDFKKPYLWIQDHIGFYPLFLAVGETENDIMMTGYQNNWRRIVSSYIIGKNRGGKCVQKNRLRKRSEFPNDVLFSFEDIDGVFMDYQNWHIPLGEVMNDCEVTEYQKRIVFKQSWKKSRWLRMARENPHSVQVVVPKLNLSSAKRVWVRNRETKIGLDEMGFQSVEVKRLPVEY